MATAVEQLRRERINLETLGSRRVRKIAVAMRVRAIKALKSGKDPRAGISSQLPVLQDAVLASMILSHLRGQLRSRTAILEKGPRKFAMDPLSEALRFVKERANLSGDDIERLKSLYGDHASKVTSGFGELVDKKLAEATEEIIGKNLHIRDGVKVLQERLDASGLTSGDLPKYSLERMIRDQVNLAYMAGRLSVNESEEVRDLIWGYEYTTVGDDRVREEHMMLEGVRLPKDDPFWEKNMPPNGYNCRCSVIEIFNDEDTTPVPPPEPELVVDEDTGESFTITPGADTGFEFNPLTLFKDLKYPELPHIVTAPQGLIPQTPITMLAPMVGLSPEIDRLRDILRAKRDKAGKKSVAGQEYQARIDQINEILKELKKKKISEAEAIRRVKLIVGPDAGGGTAPPPPVSPPPVTPPPPSVDSPSGPITRLLAIEVFMELCKINKIDTSLILQDDVIRFLTKKGVFPSSKPLPRFREDVIDAILYGLADGELVKLPSKKPPVPLPPIQPPTSPHPGSVTASDINQMMDADPEWRNNRELIIQVVKRIALKLGVILTDEDARYYAKEANGGRAFPVPTNWSSNQYRQQVSLVIRRAIDSGTLFRTGYVAQKYDSVFPQTDPNADKRPLIDANGTINPAIPIEERIKLKSSSSNTAKIQEYFQSPETTEKLYRANKKVSDSFEKYKKVKDELHAHQSTIGRGRLSDSQIDAWNDRLTDLRMKMEEALEENQRAAEERAFIRAEHRRFVFSALEIPEKERIDFSPDYQDPNNVLQKAEIKESLNQFNSLVKGNEKIHGLTVYFDDSDDDGLRAGYSTYPAPTPMDRQVGKLNVGKDGLKRSVYDDRQIYNLHGSQDPAGQVMFHELGHVIESHVEGAQEAALEFLRYRTKDSPTRRLNDVFSQEGFTDTQESNKNHFDRFWDGTQRFRDRAQSWYTGKFYDWGPGSGVDTEIISCGLEALWLDPEKFFRKDPEYANFMLGILDGSLRKKKFDPSTANLIGEMRKAAQSKKVEPDKLPKAPTKPLIPASQLPIAEQEALKKWKQGNMGLIQAGETGVSKLSKAPASEKAIRLAKEFNQALDKVQNYEGTIYRGISSTQHIPEIAKRLSTIGNEFSLDFTESATTDKEIAGFFAHHDTPSYNDENLLNTVLEIRSKTGKDIQSVAGGFEFEKEILIRKGTKYRVVEIRTEMVAGKTRTRGGWKNYAPRPVKYVVLEEVE